MRMGKIFKDERFWYFVGGVALPTLGKALIGHPQTRKVVVNALAKGMQLQKDATTALVSMREEAEDICCDAKTQAFSPEE